MRFDRIRGRGTPKKPADFVSANGIAKSDAVAHLVRLARRERFAYDDFLYICQQARKKLGLHKPKKEKKLPKLLPENALRRFFREIQACGECSTKSCSSCSSTRRCG